MSDDLFILNCLAFGDIPIEQRLFSCMILKHHDYMVRDLELKMVKRVKAFGCFASNLSLWKPLVPVIIDHSLENSLGEDPFSGSDRFQRLSPDARLSEVSLELCEAGCLHILVQITGTAGEQVTGSPAMSTCWNETDDMELCREECIKSFRDEDLRLALLNRLYDKRGVPVALYSPVFNDFATRANSSASIPFEQLVTAFQLCAAVTAHYPDEPQRQKAIMKAMADALMEPIIPVPIDNNTDSGGTILTLDRGLVFHRAILEIGTGNDKLDLQGGSWFQSCWLRHEADRARNQCSCPSFIITIIGPWMAISGAVFLEDTLMQPLINCTNLDIHFSDDSQLLRVARVLLALRNSLKALDQFYKSMNIPVDSAAPAHTGRLFPHVASYPADGREVPFTYITSIAYERATNPIFKAETASGDLIVVKFASQYNSAAHRLLANHNLAPKLLYSGADEDQTHGNTEDLKMVVMEFVGGKTAAQLCDSLPPSFCNQVKEGIDVLHADGYVFGDLRLVNIMITDKRVFFIDFDWCGVDGVAKYPEELNDLNDEIPQDPDVRPGGVMRKRHDLFMLELWMKCL